MVKQQQTDTPPALDAALVYAARGWHVFPLNGKVPYARTHGFKDATTDEAQIRRWWQQRPAAGIGIACEPSGLVVVDLDVKGDVDGVRAWAALVHDIVHDGPYVKTPSGGLHLYFDAAGVPYESNGGKVGPGIDVRCVGGYVAAPPTSGYRWLSSAREPLAVPEIARGLLPCKGEPRRGSSVHVLKTGDPSRERLATRLANPPAGAHSGRNTWLFEVGCEVAEGFEFKDRYMAAMLHMAVDKIDRTDFGDAEVEKVLNSAWQTTRRKHNADGQLSDDNGWLFSDGDRIWTLIVRKRKGEDPEETLEQWANFNIEALGVAIDDNDERTYDINLHTDHGTLRCDLPAVVLGNTNMLHSWLAKRGCTIAPPDDRRPGTQHARLHLFIMAQDPPKYRAVPSLGWHHGQFLTHDGVIDAEHGLQPFTDTKPAALLKQWAPFTYGFDVSEADAVAALREVLTFHDPMITAVFGSWWAACYMKPLLPGQFPFMLIEALSGAGKTEGFFGLMHAMSGNTAGPLTATRAALRDYLSAHNAGPQWIDDPDDTNAIEDLLRAMTTGASVAKKGEDNTTQALVALTAPLMLSGEGFPALHQQRAYTNRAILLEPPEVTHRKSLHDPTVDQYRDLLLFKQRYPQPQCMAGTLARLAIKHGPAMLRDIGIAKEGGRNAAHHRILLFGAELLSRMTGDKRYPLQVAKWCVEEAKIDRTENALTLEVIPAALVILGTGHTTAVNPVQGIYGMPDLRPPVLIVDGEMLVNAQALYEWWNHHNHGHIDQRTASKTALTKQLLQASTDLHRKRISPDPKDNRRERYRALRPEMAEACWQRAFDRPFLVSSTVRDTRQQTLPLAPDEPVTDYRAYWCDSDGTAFDAL